MKAIRLASLSVLFLLLLNEPLITLVDQPVLVLGIPVLYIYVMVVWALLIGLLAYVIHRSVPTDDPLSDDE